MLPASTPRFRRAATIAGLILLVVGIDALTGFSLLAPASCITLFIVQLLAMTAGAVVAAVGLVVLLFSRFQSSQAFYAVAGALALGGASLLLNHALAWIGLACLD